MNSNSQGNNTPNHSVNSAAPPKIQLQCPHCRANLQIDASQAGTVASCPYCNGKFQVPIPVAASPHPFAHFSTNHSEVTSKKLAAGLCGILIGTFGIHKFILGYNNTGTVMLVCSIVGFVGGACVIFPILLLLVMQIIGLIEGIIYLTKSDIEFEQTYIQQKREWF